MGLEEGGETVVENIGILKDLRSKSKFRKQFVQKLERNFRLRTVFCSKAFQDTDTERSPRLKACSHTNVGSSNLVLTEINV